MNFILWHFIRQKENQKFLGFWFLFIVFSCFEMFFGYKILEYLVELPFNEKHQYTFWIYFCAIFLIALLNTVFIFCFIYFLMKPKPMKRRVHVVRNINSLRN